MNFLLKKTTSLQTHFHIDPLKAGWHSKPLKNHFRSGCAPIDAVHKASKQIADKTTQVVVISGEDNIRSSYPKETRQKLMAIYGDGLSIADLYNRLAETFIQAHQISKDDFRWIAGRVFLKITEEPIQEKTVIAIRMQNGLST